MLLKFSLAFLKHCSLWTYRVATAAVLLAGIGFVTLVLGLRYVVLPNINDYREPISRAISQAADQQVTIGAITGSWQGYRPELRFIDVTVLDARGQPALALERVETVLSWLSLFSAEVRFDSLQIFEPRLEVRRDASSVLWVAGIAMEQGGGGGGFGDWLLAQRQVIVRDAAIAWVDERRGAPELLLEKVNFRLDSDGELHRFGLTAVPPAQVASPIVVRGELTGATVHDLQSWHGRLFAEFGYADLAEAQAWISTPMEISRGTGSLRLWMGLTGTRLSAATADLHLANVQTRIAPQLPELALASLQGRLGWKQDGRQTEVSATGLGFVTAQGLKLAPMQFVFTNTGTGDDIRRSELWIERLDLAPAVQLAEFLPLDAQLREQLAHFAPTGMVEQARFSWEGAWDPARPYVARARFSALTLRPAGAFPGFRGLNGQFDANEQGGTVSLDARDGGIELPHVFTAPLPLDVLSAEASWIFRDGRIWVTLKNVAFTNEHLAGSVRGTYHTDPEGPGTIDLTGALVRADARQVWRYIPVIAPMTQVWLQRALLAGESHDVRLRLKGPLQDFPFADERTGLFEVIAKTSGVTLDYADGWPPVTGIAGEVAFRGRKMEVRPETGAILGVRLSGVRASVSDLGKHDEHLLVKGSAAAPTAEFLRFVGISPVARHINGLTEQIRARGEAKLSLELDLPLHRFADAAVSGELALRDNQIVVDPRLPPLENFSADIAFTQHSVNVRDGRARLLGNPFSFEAANRDDGTIATKLSGTLDAGKLAGLSNQPALRFLDGQIVWRGSIGLRDKMAMVRFDSDLVGLASKLPAPFTKLAQASLPLHVELRERAAHQSQLGVTLGNVASAQLLLDAADPDGIRRGMLSFGGVASLPSADGLWLNGSLDTVDMDAWRTALADSPGGAQVDFAGASLQIGILDAYQRRFHDLKIEATKRNAVWQIVLGGREVAGELSWAAEGDGRLVGRLSKLALPAPATALQADQPINFSGERLPSLDLNADNFQFEGKDLGRLVVVADRQSAGWRLQRLEIVNPDSNLRVSGFWAVAEASRTDVTARLEVGDIGKFFARVGWPEGVKGGTALLEGPVAWAGPPTRIDYASLSGKLKLEAKNGRFQEVEPGVAKLLGILSLQALPRRITLDFQDIFSKGFTFDRIGANVNLAAGVAQTDDFLMEGSAAKVAMRGRVDLAAETQNLTVKVTPSLTESIAVAGALVNPAVGVAAYIAQKALKDPFGKIASFDYTVTGTWADPVVTRVNKTAPDNPSRR